MAEAPVRPETAGGLTKVGIISSGIWLFLLGTYCLINSAQVLKMQPNEVGDFLAGGFAPLAFFWLVLGFFQQGAELRNSGRALWLQGEELRNSVEQQRQLVEVAREQLTFEADRLARENDRARLLAQPKLELTVGGSTGTINGREQSFVLANHGRACTRVEIYVGSSASPIRFGQLDSGKAVEFRVMVTPEWPGVDVRVEYLDQHSEPGSHQFDIRQTGGALAIT